jgi:hypothetical protein
LDYYSPSTTYSRLDDATLEVLFPGSQSGSIITSVSKPLTCETNTGSEAKSQGKTHRPSMSLDHTLPAPKEGRRNSRDRLCSRQSTNYQMPIDAAKVSSSK